MEHPYNDFVESMDKFQENGAPLVHAWSGQKWSENFRKIHSMLHNIDFEKKFRIIVDYDPEGEMVSRIYYATETECMTVQAEALNQKF